MALNYTSNTKAIGNLSEVKKSMPQALAVNVQNQIVTGPRLISLGDILSDFISSRGLATNDDVLKSSEIGIGGVQGIQGIQGTQGVPAMIASQGSIGVQGDQGLLGAQGNQGMRGIPGDDAKDGDPGQQGTRGLQGVQNEIVGPMGPQGISIIGPQGTTGHVYKIEPTANDLVNLFRDNGFDLDLVTNTLTVKEIICSEEMSATKGFYQR